MWRYEAGGAVVEKRLVMPYGQNTVHLTYRLLAGPPTVRLTLRPSMHVRAHDAPRQRAARRAVSRSPRSPVASRSRRAAALPVAAADAARAEARSPSIGSRITGVGYRVEGSRGYESRGELWSPGYFRADVGVGEAVTLIASTESVGDRHRARSRPRRWRPSGGACVAWWPPRIRPPRTGMGAELVLAADQFIVTPVGRVRDAARARAGGDEARTIIAGYHWFTDWGRDTMIALAGLTLATGRHVEGGVHPEDVRATTCGTG